MWVAVDKAVSPAANTRRDKAPTVGTYEPYAGASPVPEFAHPDWKEEAPKDDE